MSTFWCLNLDIPPKKPKFTQICVLLLLMLVFSASGVATTALSPRVYEKADAVVDMPGAFFFEEILEAFPECKVILSLRNEESWIESFVNQLQLVEAAKSKLERMSPTMMKFRYIYRSYLNAFYGSNNTKSTYVLRKRFRIHNDRVRSVVPPEKLLIYNVKQGWKPLCDFLGCEIPNLEFPHENIRGELANTALKKTRLGDVVKQEFQQSLLIICSVLIPLVAMIVFITYKTYH